MACICETETAESLTQQTSPSNPLCDRAATTNAKEHVESDNSLSTLVATMTLEHPNALSSQSASFVPTERTPDMDPTSTVDLTDNFQLLSIQEEPAMEDAPLEIFQPQPYSFSIQEEPMEDEKLLELFPPQPQIPSLQEVREEQEEDEKPLPFEMFQPQPQTPPKSAGSLSPMLLQPSYKPPPRNRSPYARPHLRTLSSPLSAPPMMRAHSSPTFNSPQLVLSLPSTARSSSPLRSPKRVRSPFRSSSDESYPPTFHEPDIESIHEDEPLDITPRASDSRLSLEPSPILYPQHSNTFPRSRRRPASPLHQVSSLTSTPTSASSTGSPLLSATRFNEAFPSDLPYTRTTSLTSSSVPSTPTSTRSRSPSISSLETIPDSPDAEEAAIEADKLEKLRSAANGTDGFRRGSFDTLSRNAGFGNRDKRKRWSVCGAEKRSDLNLETIWED